MYVVIRGATGRRDVDADTPSGSSDHSRKAPKPCLQLIAHRTHNNLPKLLPNNTFSCPFSLFNNNIYFFTFFLSIFILYII
jgi:hypothetical protein